MGRPRVKLGYVGGRHAWFLNRSVCVCVGLQVMYTSCDGGGAHCE